MSMQRKTLTLEETFLGPQLPKHDYGAGSNRIHQTCALVGNSGILLGSNVSDAFMRGFHSRRL